MNTIQTLPRRPDSAILPVNFTLPYVNSTVAPHGLSRSRAAARANSPTDPTIWGLHKLSLQQREELLEDVFFAILGASSLAGVALSLL